MTLFMLPSYNIRFVSLPEPKAQVSFSISDHLVFVIHKHFTI